MAGDISWNRRRLCRMVALLGAVAGMAFVTRLGTSSAAPAVPSTPVTPPLAFQKDIRPALEANCLKCHNATKHKGDVDFSPFTDDKSIARGRKVWRKAI